MGGRIYRPEQGTAILELPEIGRLHIGKKQMSQSGKEYPVSVDYFIPSGKYAGLFEKAMGEKPSIIQVIFPSDDPLKVCNERYEYRDNSGALVARGDGRVFEVWDGKKYAHTIDPRTGYPVSHNLLSATVIAPNATLADAYATYCMVIGLEASKEFIESDPDLEACLIYDHDGEFCTWMSDGIHLR